MNGQGLKDPFLEDILQAEVRFVLVAMSLEIYGHGLPGRLQKDLEGSKDALLTAALSSTPTLNLKNDRPHVRDAFCLLLLSYGWCISEQLAKTSIRCCSLARITMNELQAHTEDFTPSARKFIFGLVDWIGFQIMLVCFTDN
ncbi:hypothetical protein N7451_000220 [Penicillium sp. IBT 35674x]|nr:hypothetical protein N7451_000220 [Penicillium sp. IBT 35674x]